MRGHKIWQYVVFHNFLGGESVIYVNFARYSVAKPRDGDENP